MSDEPELDEAEQEYLRPPDAPPPPLLPAKVRVIRQFKVGDGHAPFLVGDTFALDDLAAEVIQQTGNRYLVIE